MKNIFGLSAKNMSDICWYKDDEAIFIYLIFWVIKDNTNNHVAIEW